MGWVGGWVGRGYGVRAYVRGGRGKQWGWDGVDDRRFCTTSAIGAVVGLLYQLCHSGSRGPRVCQMAF